MHSSEGTPITVNSAKSSPPTTNDMGLNQEDHDQGTDMCEIKPMEKESPSATQAPYQSGPPVGSEPSLNAADSESLRMDAVVRHSNVKQRSFDSTFPDLSSCNSPPAYPNQTHRKLKGSLSWPSARPKVSRPLFSASYGDNHTVEISSSNQDREENNNHQIPASRYTESSYIDRPSCMQAASPTQEISQMLRETSLRNPPSDNVKRQLSFNKQLYDKLYGYYNYEDHSPKTSQPTATSASVYNDHVSRAPRRFKQEFPSTNLEQNSGRLSCGEQINQAHKSHTGRQIGDTRRVCHQLDSGFGYHIQDSPMDIRLGSLPHYGQEISPSRFPFDGHMFTDHHDRDKLASRFDENVSSDQYTRDKQASYSMSEINYIPKIIRHRQNLHHQERRSPGAKEKGARRKSAPLEEGMRQRHPSHPQSEAPPSIMNGIQSPPATAVSDTQYYEGHFGDRLSSWTPSRKGGRSSWQKMGACGVTRPIFYPYQYKGASRFPHLRHSVPPSPSLGPPTQSTVHARRNPKKHDSALGSSKASDGTKIESTSKAESSCMQQTSVIEYQGEQHKGFSKDTKMLQICDAFPFHTQTMQQETDFMIDDSWGPSATPLPDFAYAFNPRASSPGAFSIDSNVSSEHPGSHMMDLTDMAPGSPLSEADFEDINQIIQMELQKQIDIHNICQEINISPDPLQWTIDDVARWIRHISRQHCLAEFKMEYFFMNGLSLCKLTQQDFLDRAPKCGDFLFNSLEMWRFASQQPLNFQPEQVVPVPEVVPQEMHRIVPQIPQDMSMLPPELPYPVPQAIPVPNMHFTVPYTATTEMFHHDDVETASVASAGSSSDDQSIPSPAPTGTGPDTSMTPNHTGSIHLWQFLKELLLQPESYSYCIRWLDRSQGIFKIEDSVKVASLWGRRKNRPAMNYDKMSRSIRQYYKKGIMKKTEVSQRLVYQFVHPC